MPLESLVLGGLCIRRLTRVPRPGQTLWAWKRQSDWGTVGFRYGGPTRDTPQTVWTSSSGTPAGGASECRLTAPGGTVTRIEALGYRSLRYVSQPLLPFQVLVGPNASGKSAFLDVIAFLGDLLRVGWTGRCGETYVLPFQSGHPTPSTSFGCDKRTL
jgi:hypothetical protein